MEITIPPDCNNAPKKRIINAFLIAFYQKEESAWKQHLSDDVVFVQNGEVLKGLEEVASKNTVLQIPDQFLIEQTLTHGKFCACHGRIAHNNSHAGIAYFCDFKSAGSKLIQRITVYQIPLPSE